MAANVKTQGTLELSGLRQVGFHLFLTPENIDH